MSQTLAIYGFEWVKNLSKFNEDLMKLWWKYDETMMKLQRNYDENSDNGYFLEVDLEYLKTLFNSDKDIPFLLKRKKN